MKPKRRPRLALFLKATIAIGAVFVGYVAIVLWVDHSRRQNVRRIGAIGGVHFLAGMLELFRKQKGYYPETLVDLIGTELDGDAAEIPENPYSKNGYVYRRTGDKAWIVFLGRDDKPGGDGLDADYEISLPRVDKGR